MPWKISIDFARWSNKETANVLWIEKEIVLFKFKCLKYELKYF